MRHLLNEQQAREADLRTSAADGIPGPVLMERAALCIADVINKRYKDDCRILILCGSGNNGGDGFAAARLLLETRRKAEVFFVCAGHRRSDENIHQEKICIARGVPFITDPDFGAYDLIVDAVFGNRCPPIDPSLARIIQRVNESGAHILAIDMPSGVFADNGNARSVCIKADTTVTFSYAKTGHYLFPGRDFCGEVIVADVGIRAENDPVYLPDYVPGDEDCFLLEKEDLARLLPGRPKRSNKGTYGKVLIAAGCEGMAGAAYLCSRAAYESGCGLAAILSHAANRPVIQSLLPEAVFISDPGEGEVVSSEKCSAIVCGPGLGTLSRSREILQSCGKRADVPLVLDADALNLAAAQGLPKREPFTTVVTPHPGEMSRLCSCSVKDVLEDPAAIARRYAIENKVICVLKDATTIITDGRRTCLSPYGSSGMASGGSGDILAGIIGSLLAQGMEPFMAACAGVMIHGLAGEEAAAAKGERGMLSGDILTYIPSVLKGY